MADVRIIRGFISDPEVLTRHSFNALNRGEKCSIIYSKEKPRTVLSILWGIAYLFAYTFVGIILIFILHVMNHMM